MDIYFIIAIGTIGFAFYYLNKKRKFDRLNEFGEAKFASYWDKVKKTLVDELLRFAGIGLMVLSVTTFAFNYAEDWAWLFVLMIGAFAFEELFYHDRRKMGHVKIIR